MMNATNKLILSCYGIADQGVHESTTFALLSRLTCGTYNSTIVVIKFQYLQNAKYYTSLDQKP